MSATTNVGKPGVSRRILALLIGTPLVAILLLVAFWGGSDDVRREATLFTVQRGDLAISVLEGGNLQAIESQEIRSEMKGHQGVKILEIVEEGYVVTEEDIASGKILVELDSADLVDRRTNQKIVVQSAEAAYIDALQAYDIQISRNESTVKLKELTAKFALMDFEKFVGEDTAADILQALGLDRKAEEIHAARVDDGAQLLSALNGASPSGDGAGRGKEATESRDIPIDDELLDLIAKAMGENGRPVQPERFRNMMRQRGSVITAEMAQNMSRWGIDVYAIALESGKLAPAVVEDVDSSQAPVEIASTYIPLPAVVDFSDYVDLKQLEDGAAKQTLRKHEDNLIVAREEFVLAQTQLEGKERLAERDFVTQTELDAEKVRVSKARIALESAKTALALYKKYEFPKDAETLLSKYEDALMEFERSKKMAVSVMAQASVKLKTAESRHGIEQRKLIDLEEQIEKSVIRAKRQGLVIYGGQNRGFNDSEQIQEGATVRQRQLILTIPDMTKMSVEVKVHESVINRISVGQSARIRVDAFQGEVLEGEVVKVAGVPDSRNRWMNPNLKVFTTVVKINGVRDRLRPGMSAEVEILIETVRDVVYVPLHAVFGEGKENVCYVLEGGEPQRRVLELGVFNEDFIEIKSGLDEGEKVYLRSPTIAPISPDSNDGDDDIAMNPPAVAAA